MESWLSSLWASIRGRREGPTAPRDKERELSPREKLARDGGMASFGLNPPWWIRPEEYRRRVAGRRK